MAKQLVVVCWVTITKKLKAFELQLCSSYTLIDMSCWHKMLSHSYINDLKIFLCQCVERDDDDGTWVIMCILVKCLTMYIYC